MRKSVLAVAGSAVVMGSLAGCSMARHSEEDRAQWRARIVEKVADRLDLDATQRDKLEALAQKLQAQRMAVRAAGGSGEPRAQVEALLAGARFDQAAAQRLVDEKTQAVRVGSTEVIAATAAFYDSLNPAQQQKVREFIERRGHGRWSRHG
ncbi:Spy/CpxP family protein refolding chaperone [Variovorax dokdonensis]|uniref:Spy/CpxP family protein refolding chaperone n=1 Tax=Variovorax dokdonensis TaxID=344883 RepID=A0ABT7NG08_9BURK|nr:Spy/CpxP family protein refolding chaperone [Variovorax dokdonensis]MDM0046884.1 Spy/CpxP family protein refolding chaperone [Variovorax dokdonensis]